jgi:3-methyladenine DNA glycosylase AlkD
MVHAWAASPDGCWRRAALVSTVALNAKARGGGGDTPRTLALCEELVADRDAMVVKALSWALRALAGADAAAVRAFLEAHRAELAPRVRREVESKLTSGRKSLRRDG